MSQFNNIGPCPPAVAGFLQAKVAENVRQQDEPGWLRRQFIRDIPRRGERVADLRWFADCDIASLACSGRLLGRWMVSAASLKPLEDDFTPAPPPVPGSDEDYEQRHPISDPLHTLVVNFAITVQGDRCVLHEIDLDGNVKLSAYEMPHGLASESFGPMIGEPLLVHFDRDPWDSCLPEQYQLVRGKPAQNVSSQT